MAETQSRGMIEALLRRHGLRPDRRLGQHFLADPNIVARIVATADIAGRPVVEVGAGTGTLTAAIASRASSVVAYEVDDRLRPVLEETLGGAGNVELRFEDAIRMAHEGDPGGGPWALVANLPYNVGTPLLLDLVRGAFWIDRFVVMVQRQVAARLTASPGTRVYGIPSVVVALHTIKEDAFAVPRQVFVPPPNVESTVVRLDRVAPPLHVDVAIDLAARAFGKRRKMLRRSLSAVVTPERMERCGIDPRARPEDLAPTDFVRLAAEPA